MSNLSNTNQYKIKPKIFRLIIFLLVYIFFGLFLFLFFRSQFILYFLIVYGLIVLTSFIALIYSASKIRFTLSISENQITVTDKIGISLISTNNSWFPFLKCICSLHIDNVYYKNNTDFKVIIPSVARDSSAYPVIFDTSMCGNITVHLRKVEIYDWCGLFYIDYTLTENISVSVLPLRASVKEEDTYTIFAGMEDNEDTSKKGMESFDISNIREYVPGDRIKDIHWKLSVKKDELLVKERVKAAENKITIWMDSSLNKNICESLLASTYNLIEYTITNNIVTNLMWFNYNKKEVEYEIINSISELNEAFRKIYDSSTGRELDDIRNILLSYNYDISSIIRICAKDGNIGAILF